MLPCALLPVARHTHISLYRRANQRIRALACQMTACVAMCVARCSPHAHLILTTPTHSHGVRKSSDNLYRILVVTTLYPNYAGPSLEPPRVWISAALSAGYIPCLEAFARRLASPTCRYPAPLASRASAVLPLLQGRWLGVLAACGEERQAAALLVTAIKATAVLAGQDATRRHALQAFADIPGALAGVVMEQASMERAGG